MRKTLKAILLASTCICVLSAYLSGNAFAKSPGANYYWLSYPDLSTLTHFAPWEVEIIRRERLTRSEKKYEENWVVYWYNKFGQPDSVHHYYQRRRKWKTFGTISYTYDSLGRLLHAADTSRRYIAHSDYDWTPDGYIANIHSYSEVYDPKDAWMLEGDFSCELIGRSSNALVYREYTVFDTVIYHFDLKYRFLRKEGRTFTDSAAYSMSEDGTETVHYYHIEHKTRYQWLFRKETLINGRLSFRTDYATSSFMVRDSFYTDFTDDIYDGNVIRFSRWHGADSTDWEYTLFDKYGLPVGSQLKGRDPDIVSTFYHWPQTAVYEGMRVERIRRKRK